MMGPVSFNFTSSVGAGATYTPLTGWQYEYPPTNCIAEVLLNATAVGTFAAIYSGGDTIQQECPIQAGGTAGVIPNPLSTPVVTGGAGAGKRVAINVRNPTGGAVTVNGIITLIPRGGKRR